MSTGLADGSAGADTAAGGDGADTLAGDGAQEWKAPDFLHEHLRGKTMEETFAKVTEDWQKQRTQLSKAAPPEVPADADGYKFEPLESLKEVFGDTKDDPIIKASMEAAHKYKMTPDQMNGFINDVISKASAAGLLAKEPGPDYAAEMKLLLPDDQKNAPEADQKAAVKLRLDGAQLFADTLLARKEIDTGMHEEFAILLESANGVRLVEHMQKMMTREGGFKLGDTPADTPAAVTRESLKADMADPRYDTMSSKYDPAFRKKTDDGYRKLFG